MTSTTLTRVPSQRVVASAKAVDRLSRNPFVRFVVGGKVRLSAFFAMLAALFAVPQAAYAATGIDPATVTGIEGMFDNATTLIVTVLGVAAFLLTIAILGITLGMKWVRKVANAG